MGGKEGRIPFEGTFVHADRPGGIANPFVDRAEEGVSLRPIWVLRDVGLRFEAVFLDRLERLRVGVGLLCELSFAESRV